MDFHLCAHPHHWSRGENLTGIFEASKSGNVYPVLVVLEGGDVKNRYPIDEPELSIGRDVSCRLVLAQTKTSRRHAIVSYRNFAQPGAEPEVYIKDLGSTNGTFVNGARIEEVRLRDRDKIMIGSVIFAFSIRDVQAIKADEELIRMAAMVLASAR